MTQHSLDSKFWGKQGAGALIIARDTGRVFLVLRSAKVKEPGTWGLVGGAIDEGESPDTALRREVYEEVAYTGDIELHRGHAFKSDTFTYHNFIGVVESEFSPQLNWESDDAGWFDINKLPSPLHFGVQSFLRSDMGRIKKIIGSSSAVVVESLRIVQRSALRRRIREILTEPSTSSKKRMTESKIGASVEYDRTKEGPKRAFEAILKQKAERMGPNMLNTVRQGSHDHLRMLEDALDDAGIFDASLRALISGPFKMVPPHFLLRM